jgi:hypothetical protein
MGPTQHTRHIRSHFDLHAAGGPAHMHKLFLSTLYSVEIYRPSFFSILIPQVVPFFLFFRPGVPIDNKRRKLVNKSQYREELYINVGLLSSILKKKVLKSIIITCRRRHRRWLLFCWWDVHLQKILPRNFFFLFLDISVQKDEDLEKRTSCSTTHRQLQEIRKLSRAPYFFLLYQFQNIF